MIKGILNYFSSLNTAGQALFVVGVLLIITFIVLLIIVLKPEKNKIKKIYGESEITDNENDFEEKMKDIDNIKDADINLNNDRTRNLKSIVDELKTMEAKTPTQEEIIQKYEDEQEDTAIISVEELLKHNNTFTYAKTEPKKIETKEEIIIYAKKLQEKGAQNVLISLGGDGAILLTEKNEVYYSNTPKGQVINTVGAGDSMVAGFVAGYLKKKDYKEALKLGIASGSATAFSAGLAMNEEINGLLKQITIEKI